MRPTENSSPESFGRRAHRPTRPSFSKLSNYRPNLPCPYLWLGHPSSRSAVYFLPCAAAPLLWENFFITGPPKILHRENLVGAPAVPPTLPSGNFQNTGRTFYDRIYGSDPSTIPGRDIFVGAPTIPTRVPLLMAACLPRASARSPHAAMRIPLSVVATC